MSVEFSDDQRYEIEDAFSLALDHGVASYPVTRQEFAWKVLFHFLGSLQQMKAMDRRYAHHLTGLTDHYISI